MGSQQRWRIAILLFMAVALFVAHQPVQALPAPATDPQTVVDPPANTIFMPLVRQIKFDENFRSSNSYYLHTIDPSILFTIGCENGQRDLDTPGTQDSLIVLDFGQPWVENGIYGVSLLHSLYDANPDQVVDASVAFAKGYWACSGLDQTSQIMMAVGVSNYGSMGAGKSAPESTKAEYAYTHGAIWGNVVRRISEQVRQLGYASQISVAGAFDAEIAWNTPAVTRSWVNGFDANDQGLYVYYDFGACEGCPQSANPTWTGYNGWTQQDRWYVAWGAPPAEVIPEIYLTNGVHAKQWKGLSLFAVAMGYGRIDFSGAFTQYQACLQSPGECYMVDNTPIDGQRQLYYELNANPTTAQSLRWESDILWLYKSRPAAVVPTGDIINENTP